MQRSRIVAGLALLCARMAIGQTVDAVVPAPPIPFHGADGRWHLSYELNLPARHSKLEVSGDSGPLASFEGTALAGMIAPKRPVAFLDIDLPDEHAPQTLRHRLIVDGAAVDLPPVAVRTAKPIVIGPPLRGEWFAANGPGNRSDHRRAIVTLNGRATIAQRYAIDWVQVKGDATFKGNEKDNRSYYSYGAEALAVADAKVAAIHDGIPENVPGENSRAVPITLETVAGNHVILDLGGGNYCMYAHLQPGSLKVKVGDKVKRGQELGLVGNSGNSTEPHLHFQVMDGPSPLGAEGLPYHIDAFELLSGNFKGKKENALPMESMRVKF